MGCISSKVVSRSLSLQEDLKQSSHRTANGIRALEELIVSKNGNDQLLALVCTADTVANTLQSRSFTSETSTSPRLAVEQEPIMIETSNTEFTASLEQGRDEKHVQSVLGSTEIGLTRRSRSYHWSPEHKASSLSMESSLGISDDRGAARTWSFHTVEEYDAMVESLRLARARQTDFDDADDGTEAKMDVPQTIHGFLGAKQSCLKEKTTADENTIIRKTSNLLSSVPGNLQEIVENPAQEDNILGKGLKRKCIAKGLESLKIPHSIEFPASASLREWLHNGGQVYSPGAYVTPKFGSYSLPISRMSDESREGAFNPELVAAFEECMQQLEAEEECILKQIAANLEEESTQEKESEEQIPSHTKD